MNTVRILIVDDNEKFRESLSRSLHMRKYECFTASCSSQALTVLNDNLVQVILLDLRLGQEDGIQVSKRLMEIKPKIPIIMLTGYATIESAVEVMKNGVVDYIQKPIDMQKLIKTINNVITVSENSRDDLACSSLDTCFLETYNEKMRRCLHLARQLADSKIPILIQGESGTGKEVIAEYIHQNSKRNTLVMQKSNCAAFTESLLDNELFGHEKGAYTGATEQYKGVFVRSDKSSLFLDEIGDMPLALQAKILRAIQNQEIQPIGSEKTIHVDVRFLSATNKNLSTMIEEGKFRKDLYYRLNAGSIELPPLRERKEDILPMVSFFIQRFSKKVGEKQILSKNVEDLFLKYPWPGNIRELMNVIQYACLVATGNEIFLVDLPSSFINNLQKNGIVDEEASEREVQSLEEGEANLIRNTLKRFNNNKKEAAEVLRISRSTLYSKIKKFSLDEGLEQDE